MATALGVVSIITGVIGIVQQSKIAKAQRKQNRITNKVAAIGRKRNIKRQIAASRIQAAQQQSAGFSLGVSGGTAVAGGIAGLASDTASSVGFSNLQATGSGFVAGLQNQISGFQQTANVAQGIGSIAGGLANNPQAVAGIEDFFGF